MTGAVQYNHLDEVLPVYDTLRGSVLRSAFIGFSASTTAAVVSNWVRVVKTMKQTSARATTYTKVCSAGALQVSIERSSAAQLLSCS